jgi:hypothetical protein
MRIASLATAVILAFSANVYASYMDSLRTRCEAYGSTPGTRDFYQCLHDLNLQEQKKQEQKTGASMLSGCKLQQASAVVADEVVDAAWNPQSLVVSRISPVSLGCTADSQ